MWTLVMNSGSSSVKVALLDPESGGVRLSGLAERLGSPQGRLRLVEGDATRETPLPGADYAGVFGALLGELERLGLRGEVGVVGHRVVHGGERFSQPALVDERVLAAIRECVPLAPLHNPANLAGIEAALAAFPGVPHVAVFDTAFHQTLPEVAYRYAVPEGWYREHGVRRYGFHGTSHAYVAGEAARLLGRPLRDLQLVTAHLGNGCSVASVRGGRSLDTSMGLTPLEGLVMGTRSGDVDPGLHDYLARAAGLTLSQITGALNRESGLLGLSGLGSDLRELEAATGERHPGATLAIGVFCYRLAGKVLAMCAPLSALDALVFTGGIGENSPLVRRLTLERLGLLGLRLDEAANRGAVGGRSGPVSPQGTSPAALVIHTDEERMIAREAARVLGRGAPRAQETP